MSKRHVLLYFVIVCRTISAQEADKWYFGNNAALDFSSGTPSSLSNSTMSTIEGCASFSDLSGNLLLYTDGTAVWDKSHQNMANSNWLAGHPSAVQSALIFKKPSNSNEYYIFTLGASGTGSLSYSVADMSKAAGLGSVTVKNVSLAVNMTEKLHGAMHCNGYDFWVVGHRYNSQDFLAFLVTATGVNNTPVVSTTGTTHQSFAGCMKISATGRSLGTVKYGPEKAIEIFDFDPSTGIISDPIILDTSFQSYGCEFSPDGSKFYAGEAVSPGNPGKIHQWDLCAGTDSAIIASHQILTGNAQTNNLGSLQLAPDGKIYVAERGLASLGRISQPDSSGAGAGYMPQSVALITGSCLAGLPNFIGSDFRSRGNIVVTQDSLCGKINFSFNPPAMCPKTSYTASTLQWDLGDSSAPVTGTSANISHTYSANGQYTATLFVSYPCFTDTLFTVVNYSGYDSLLVSGPSTVCVGEIVTFTASGANNYSWTTGSNGNTAIFFPKNAGTHTLSVLSLGKCQSSKLVQLQVLPCTGEAENHIDAEFSFFPNPVSETVNFMTRQKGCLRIFSHTGEEVHIMELNAGFTEFNAGSLIPGLYFIKVNRSAVKKMLIHRD